MSVSTELHSEISKLLTRYFKEKVEGYLFRDDDTYDNVQSIVDELEVDIDDLIFDANCAIDDELEKAEKWNSYKKESYRDMESFIYNCQL